MKRISISHQAWLLSTIFIAVLAILITSIQLSNNHKSETEYQMSMLSDTYMDVYNVGGISALGKRISDDFYSTYCVVIDANKNILYSNADSWQVPEDYSVGLHYQQLSNGNSDILMRYKVNLLPDDNLLIVVQNVSQMKTNHSTNSFIIIMILSTITLAGLSSYFLGFFVNKRLNNINQICAEIMKTGNLDMRIPHKASGKDFDELAENLNLMLNKIQNLMSDVRQVSDNIAHDLRTPLTRMRNKLELLENEANKGNNIQQPISDLKAEADKLLNIFSALLRITNIESGQRHASFSSVDIHLLLNDLIELYEPLSSEKQQTLRLESTTSFVNADRDLLFQALANILDNAVKYTQQGGEINIALKTTDTEVIIEINDNGLGVPESETSKLLQRFYRVESSRNLQGNGLGLSLVEAVLNLHNSSITFASNSPGLSVILNIPTKNQRLIIN